MTYNFVPLFATPLVDDCHHLSLFPPKVAVDRLFNFVNNSKIISLPTTIQYFTWNAQRGTTTILDNGTALGQSFCLAACLCKVCCLCFENIRTFRHVLHLACGAFCQKINAWHPVPLLPYFRLIIRPANPVISNMRVASARLLYGARIMSLGGTISRRLHDFIIEFLWKVNFL